MNQIEKPKKTANLILIICGAALMLGVQVASALSSYVSQVPNGSVNSCSTCHGASGPPALNPFGNAFLNNNANWDKTLASQDSDGDGYSNGTELGDPQGVWTPGSANPAGPVY